MDREFCPEKHHFSTVKDRIMKTSRIIEMYKNKQEVLAKATKAFKNLKTLYENSLTTAKRLEQENGLVSYRNTVLTSKIDEFYANYNKILTELAIVKPEHEKLLAKYNQKLIECQNLEENYNRLRNQCTCHQEFDSGQFKYKGMKMYWELKQKYNQLVQDNEEKSPNSTSDDEQVPQILREAAFIENIDLVTRFTESPPIEDSPPTANSDNFEALKRKQIDRRRKYWIPNMCNFPPIRIKRRQIRKTPGNFANLVNRLVRAKIKKIMGRRRKRQQQFTSETESELERLFDDRKQEILSRNRRLIALARTQNPNSSDSDVVDSGLVTASPKNSTEDDWGPPAINRKHRFTNSKILEDSRGVEELADFDLGPQMELQNEKSLDLGVFGAQINNLEEPQREKSSDLRILEVTNDEATLEASNLAYEAQMNNLEEDSGIFEVKTIEATLEAPNLDFGACGARKDTLEEPQTKKSLDLRIFEEKSMSLGNTTVKATLEASNLHLGACGAQTNNSEEPHKEKSLDLGIFEDKTYEATLEASNLDSKACGAQINLLEEPQREKSSNLRIFEDKSKISEDLNDETTLEASNLDLKACGAQLNSLEEPQREESSDLGIFEDKLKISKDTIVKATLEASNLDLGACGAQKDTLEEPQREKSLNLGILKGTIVEATLEASNLDLGACGAQTNNLEKPQREKSLDLRILEVTNDDATLEASNLNSKPCGAQINLLEEPQTEKSLDLTPNSNLETCGAPKDLLEEPQTEKPLDFDLKSPASPTDSLIEIIKSLKHAPMLSPLPQSPQKTSPNVATPSTVRQRIVFDEKRAPKRRAPIIIPQMSAKQPKLDVLASILDGMGTLKPSEAFLEAPKPKLTGEEARMLMDELIMFSANELALNEIAKRLRGQNTDFVAWIILDKLRTDVGKIHKSGNNPNCPPLTRLQQILLGFLCKLEKHDFPGILDKFLDLADGLVSKRHNNNVTRLFMALCKMRQDLGRARRFVFRCFCRNRNLAPVSVLFVVLKVYPEVLPHQNDDPLARVLVQICFNKLQNQSLKFIYLKDLLEAYYNYKQEPIEAVFNDFFRAFRENPAQKQIEWSLLLLVIHQTEDWIFDKLQNQFWPLYSKIPCSNSNLKALVILFIGKICKQLKNQEVLGKVRQWFEDLLQTEGDIFVKRSIIYVHKNCSELGLNCN